MLATKAPACGAGSPGSGYTDYNGLPSSMLAMGDILNDTVSDHPQFLPFPTFDRELSVAQALRPYAQYGQINEQFPYNTNSNLQLAASDGDQAPE